MIGFSLGEFCRLTLLGASLGVCPLALIVAAHHLRDWIRGDTFEAPILFMARFGTFLVVFPITWLLFTLKTVDPFHWMTIMYGVGLGMVFVAYFVIARRWGHSRPRHRRTKEDP